MNSFDLGIIFGFQDKASKGLNNAMSTLNELGETVDNAKNKMEELSDKFKHSVITSGEFSSAMSVVSGQVLSTFGGMFADLGKMATDTMQGIISECVQVGQSVANQRRSLAMLFKSAEAGNEVFNWVKDFAMTSMFNFSDLLRATTMMKAVNVDIRKDLVTTSGKAQNLLMYAGDLAAVFPDMHNVYGSGIQAAMGSIKEYISEGNYGSLKRNAGLDIREILGESKGSTVEERGRQIADLIEKIGAYGMTKALQGTPQQRLSNLEDLWFGFMTDVAESGVNEKYKEVVNMVVDSIETLKYNGQLKTFAKTMSEAIVNLMKPIELLAKAFNKFFPPFAQFLAQNPIVAKMAVAIFSLGGASIVAVGKLMQLTGGIVSFGGSLSMLYPHLQTFGNYITTTFGMTIPQLITRSIYKIGALALAGYLLYKAYDANLFGIKKLFEDTFLVIGASISAVTQGYISDEQYKALEKEGLIPLALTLARLGTLIKEFFGGISYGFKLAIRETKVFFSELQGATGIDFSQIVHFLNVLLDTGEKLDIEKWRELKEDFAVMGMWAGRILVPLLLISKAFKFIGTTISYLFAPFSWMLKIVTKVASVAWKLLTPFRWLASKAMSLLVTWAGWGKHIGYLSRMWTQFVTMIKGLNLSFLSGVLSRAFAPFYNLFSGGFLNGIKNFFPTLFGAFKSIFTQIWAYINANFFNTTAWKFAVKKVFSPLGQYILSIMPNWVKSMFGSLINTIKGLPAQALAWVRNLIPNSVVTVFNNLRQAISGLFSNLPTQVMTWIRALPSTLWGVLRNFAGTALTFIRGLLPQIAGAIRTFLGSSFAQFFVNLGRLLVTPIMGVLTTIASFFGISVGWVVALIVAISTVAYVAYKNWDSICDYCKKKWQEFLQWLGWDSSKPAWDNFKTIAVKAWTSIKETAKDVIDSIFGWFNDLLVKIDEIGNRIKNWKQYYFGIKEDVKPQAYQYPKIELPSIPSLNWGNKVENTAPNTSIVGSPSLTTLVKPISVENPVFTPTIDLQFKDSTFTPLVKPSFEVEGKVTQLTTAVGETGGEIKGEGLMYVHPNEFLANSDITLGLREFLTRQQEVSRSEDNSVTFEKGSVVINIASTEETDLNKVADKLMQIMDRKMQLNRMSVRY